MGILVKLLGVLDEREEEPPEKVERNSRKRNLSAEV